ncbi:MAG: hypothetical protein ACWA5A_05465 [Marinibacterium sp.]
MMRGFKVLAAVTLPVLAAGCVQDPRLYETPIHTVEVSKGKVSCQLYTQEFVYWDRATDWPKSMNVDEADAICLQEGKKWQQHMFERQLD